MLNTSISVACIKSSPEQFDYFESQTGIKAIPKRKTYSTIAETHFSGFNEPRIVPELRNNRDLKAIANWATHTAIIETFLKTETTNWLFVIEDTNTLNDYDLPIIEDQLKPGFNSLSETAYIVDRHSAEIIAKNARIYYTPFQSYISDLSKIGLININRVTNLKPLINPFWYVYLPFIYVLLFVLFCIIPLYWGFKQSIGSTELFRTKEPSISR